MLPVDFEKLVKLPAGDGYPNSIRAQDLMKNFAYCDLLPSDLSDDIGIELEEVAGVTAQHQQRRLKITGGGLVGQGDMLFYDYTLAKWVVLPAPASGFFVLTHNGTIPSWSETEECS